MTTIIRTIRPRGSGFRVIWFTHKNVVEVATWLRDQGQVRPQVEFHNYGETLRIGSGTISIPSGDEGIWITDEGLLLDKTTVEDDYVDVPER